MIVRLVFSLLLIPLCFFQLSAASHYSDTGSVSYGNNGFFCCEPFEDFYFYGDYLYWRVRRCGLNYAAPLNDLAETSIGSVQSVHPKYDSGYRFGMLMTCGQRDFGFNYTHFCTDKSDSVTGGGNLAALLTSKPYQITDNGSIEYAKAHYEINLDVFDLETGCDLFTSHCSTARLFYGFKYANIYQKLITHYTEDGVLGINSVADKVSTRVNMSAYGLYFGVEGSRYLCECINMTGSISYAGLVGCFHRRLKHDSDLSILNETFNFDLRNVDLKNKCSKYVSNFNCAVGIEVELPCLCYGVWTLGLGYEFHQWFCLADFLNLHSNEDAIFDPDFFNLDNNDSGLGFDGLYVRLSVFF